MAEGKLGMSLDDLVAGGTGRARARSRPAPARARAPAKRHADNADLTIKVARRVYVGNMSWQTSWQNLKDHFKTVGYVTRADVILEQGSTRSKGYGIVEYSTSEEAARAILELDGSNLDGRPIFVREDREDPDLKPHLSDPASGGGGRKALRRDYGDHPRTGGRSGIAHHGSSTDGGVVIGRRVFVQNMDTDTSWQDLKDHFRQVGRVVHADIIKDPSGNSRGCGIVEFETAQEALQAIARMSNTELNGSTIHVREDREDREISTGRGSFNPGVGGSFGGRGAAGFPGGGRGRGGRGGRGGANQAASGCQVVVHGLPWNYAWQDLKDLMATAGQVAHTDIIQDPTGRSKGYGTVVFATPADAKNAIQTMNGAELEGRIVTVKPDKFAN
eukprot:jgi/Tetstr1/431294/TSEL_020988.t1